MPLKRHGEPSHGSGDGDGESANDICALFDQRPAEHAAGSAVLTHAVHVGPRAGRHARQKLDGDILALLGKVDQHGSTARQAAHGRLDHRDGGCGGNGRVDGISTGGQDARARLCRQRMLRHDESAAAGDFGLLDQVAGTPEIRVSHRHGYQRNRA